METQTRIKLHRVLIFKNNNIDADSVKRIFEEAKFTFDYIEVKTKEEYETVIEKYKPDLIISKYKLRSFDGLEALRLAQRKYPDVPFIFIGGKTETEFVIKSFRDGAYDFILEEHKSDLIHAVSKALIYRQKIETELRTERILEKNENRFKLFYNVCPIGIIIIEQNGIIIDANKAFGNIIGYNEAELVSRNIKDITHPLDIEATARKLEELSEEFIESNQYEKRFINKKGEVIWAKVSSLLLDDNDYNQFIVVELVEDITLQKKYKDDLIRAKRKAEEVNRLKSSFQSLISHEIRTPLTSILGVAEYMSDLFADRINKENEIFFKSLGESSSRLLNSLTHILDFFRLELGEFPVRNDLINVSSILKSVYTSFNKLAIEKNINLDLSLPEKELIISGDEYCIRESLNSVVDNSVKYSTYGTVRITAYKTDNFLKIIVVDEGIGISREKLDHIYESFNHEDLWKSRRFEGLGLGLALTKRFMLKMNGSISLESEPGTGTKVILSLPFNKSEYLNKL